MEPIVPALALGGAVTALALGLQTGAPGRRERVLERLHTVGSLAHGIPVPAPEVKPVLRIRRRFRARLGDGRYTERVQRQLERAGLQLRPSEYLLIRIVFACLMTAVGVLIGWVWFLPAFALAGYFLSR